MANSDSPKGFVCIGKEGGGDAGRSLYPVDASNGTAVFKGDLMKAESDGNITPASANDGVSVIGVAEGIYDSNKKPVKTLAASTAGYVLVVDDPNALFVVQADTGTAVAETARFATANHVAGAGSTDTGLSGHELDSSDIGTGLQLKIFGKVETPENTWAEHVDLIVKIQEHHKTTVASI
jgi:hypothetical protein|tara:strand:+ start:3164 stop:3703 length:540 start_codon:yes stop_codon:yes gene_type:complete